MHTRTLLAALGLLVPIGNAAAQYVSGFEDVTASTTGEVLTGQDSYYLPNTTSVDFLAFTYTGNALGLPANPNGGANFICGTGPAGGIFARAQRDMIYTCRGSWTAGFDILGTFTGTLPTAQNLGSFSIQPFPGGQSFIALARWTDPATAATWDADYVYFDAAGTQITASVPDPNFQMLPVDSWYRWETDFDLTTNQITEIRLTDIVAGTTATHNPAGWFMFGGSAGATVPTGFRWFGGGGVDGNTLCFDNAAIQSNAPADILYYKFDAGCGAKAINYANSGIAPTEGDIVTSLAPGSEWVAGKWASALSGSSNASSTDLNYVDTGWNTGFSGSFTVAWFIKERVSPGTGLSYFFSDVGNFRCFTNGVAGTGLWIRSWGGADIMLGTDIQALAAINWLHVACVVDDGAMTAQWYLDGVPDGAPIALAASPLVAANPDGFKIGKHSSNTSTSAYDIDEFVFANRAYSASDIANLASNYRAADGEYSASCGGHSTLFTCDGPPTVGNARYRLVLRSTANTVFCTGVGLDRCQLFGVQLPLDLGAFFPSLAGCLWECSEDLTIFAGTTDGAGTAEISLSIPNDPALSTLGLCFQSLVDHLGPDVNVTNAWSTRIGQ